MNVIIEEEVLVPDVPIIEEQVLYPSNPISVEEEVLVPAIYQEVQRQYKLDPLWDSLEETPKNHIQMIVYKGGDEAIICTGFNYFKYSMGFGNNEIKLRCFIANDSYINSLYFSNESPFDYGSTHINLLRAKFEKDSLLSLFNRLPDFTNSNSRTINIVDNPGTSELMGEDIKIATDKNWVVITK